MPRFATALGTVTLALVAAGLAVAPGDAGAGDPAPEARSLVGRYQVRGRHARHGVFTGTLGISSGREGLRYERRTGDVLERGAVSVSSGRLVLREDPRPSGSLVGGLFGGASARAPQRLASYRAEGSAYRGSFAVQGGAADDRGEEHLERAGVAGDSFELLVDGTDFFPRLEADLARARRSISVQTYLWKADETGRSIARLLRARARAGVEVRVLIDSILLEGTGRDLMDELRDDGVQVVVQHRLRDGAFQTSLDLGRALLRAPFALLAGPAAPREARGVSHHDHRKVIVVDGEAGYAGGMNLADEYRSDWHDVHGRVEGPVVGTLMDEFLDRWRAAGGAPARDLDRLYAPRRMAGDLRLDVVTSVPGLRRDVKDVYLREIGRARRKILIENAYFLDDEIIAALQKKVREKVPAVVIVPRDDLNNQPAVREALAFVEDEIIRSGIELRKYRDRMVHSKVAVIDSQWWTVGSANLDPLALDRLSELNLASRSARVAAELERRIFAPDTARSDRAAVQERSFWQRTRSGTVHLLRTFI